MTKKQAKVAAALIGASYMANNDLPEPVRGLTEWGTTKVVLALNEVGWKTLNRYGLKRTLTPEQAVRFALAKY